MAIIAAAAAGCCKSDDKEPLKSEFVVHKFFQGNLTICIESDHGGLKKPAIEIEFSLDIVIDGVFAFERFDTFGNVFYRRIYRQGNNRRFQ